MRLKVRSKTPVLDMQRAEAIALAALAFLAGDAARLSRLIAESGIGPAELRSAGDDAAIQRGILEHLLADESSLMVFAADNQIAVEEITAAHRVIAGSHGREWND